MKYSKTLIFWTSIFLILGFTVKYFLEIENFVVVYVFGGMGLIIGLVKAILIGSSNSRKTEIFAQAREMFNGNMTPKGELELLINNRKVILDYKLEDLGSRMTEYIIAKIELKDISLETIETTEAQHEIIQRNNKYYEDLYCSWGKNGSKFKERIENKLQQLENLTV